MADDALQVNQDDAIQVQQEEQQVAERPTFDTTGMSRRDIMEKISETPEVAPVAKQEAQGTATEDKSKQTLDIPGLEAPKPAAPAPVDETEKDAAGVPDAPDAGKFRVKNAAGEFAPAPDIKVEFRIGEKVYTKPLDQLVRMAYDGVAGQRAVAERKQLEAETIPRIQGEYRQQLAARDAELQAQIELNAAILADESGETWAKHHTQFAASRTPEKIAERAREDARRANEELAQSRHEQHRNEVFATHIQPTLTRVAQEFPDVDDDTKAGIIAGLTADLVDSTNRIPPTRYPEFVRRMQGPYIERVRASQNRFNEHKAAADKVRAEAEAEKQKERAEFQRKLSAAGGGLKPIGNAAPAGSGDLPLPPPKTRQEAMERIINSQ